MRRLRLQVTEASPHDAMAAAGMDILGSIVPTTDGQDERILRVQAGNAVAAREKVRAALQAEKPESIVALANSNEALNQVTRYLLERYGGSLAVLSVGRYTDADIRAYTKVESPADDEKLLSPKLDGRNWLFVRTSHETRWRALGPMMNGDECEITTAALDHLFEAEGVRFLSVRLGFTTLLASATRSDDATAPIGTVGGLEAVLRALAPVSEKRTIAGVCILQNMAPTLAAARSTLASSVLFSQKGLGEGTASADDAHDLWTRDEYARVTEGWLVGGLSCKELDCGVLGIAVRAADGSASRSILTELGISDDRYCGMMAQAGDDCVLQDCPQALSLLRRARASRTRRPLQPANRSTQSIANRPKRVMPLPVLNKSERSREYDLYPLQRSEVVYRFLFEGAMHRPLDKEVLKLDPAVSHGWQSMGILHYLGLKKEYRGIFKGTTIDDAIDQMRSQPNSADFAPIIQLLKDYQRREFQDE